MVIGNSKGQLGKRYQCDRVPLRVRLCQSRFISMVEIFSQGNHGRDALSDKMFIRCGVSTYNEILSPSAMDFL